MSVQQPFNKMGDGPKRRASEAAPSNQDLETAQVDLEDHTRRVGNAMTEEEAFEGMEMMCPATADLGSMFVTCDMLPITVQDGEIVEEPCVDTTAKDELFILNYPFELRGERVRWANDALEITLKQQYVMQFKTSPVSSSRLCTSGVISHMMQYGFLPDYANALGATPDIDHFNSSYKAAVS